MSKKNGETSSAGGGGQKGGKIDIKNTPKPLSASQNVPPQHITGRD